MKQATMVHNQHGEKLIKIEFTYDVFILVKVRTLAGVKYLAERKLWIAPIYPSTLQQLQKWGFSVDQRLINYVADKTKQIASQKHSIKIKGLKGKPFPYQYVGIEFIEKNEGRALIADEMGLGKTIQALGWCQLHREKTPVLIVVPASLKLNWAREMETWMPNIKYDILSGRKPRKLKADYIIINYDILNYWVDYLKQYDFQIMITDECHYYKSNTSKRTKAVKKLAKGIPHIIALSGTPIVNRPVEGFNAVNIIKPDLFPNFITYTRRYCNPKFNGYGWDYNGASNTTELHDILINTIMIRRLKKDVLKDLPEKLYSYIPLGLTRSARLEYTKAEDSFIEYVHENYGLARAEKASNAMMLVQYGELKRLAVQGVLQQSVEWISNFLETGNKLVVFATHKFVIDILMENFGDVAVKLDGTVTGTKRQTVVDQFQKNPDIKLFIGNIEAAGVGITLTAAASVAFLELPWSPGKLKQAIDRVHRIGQKKCVNVYYLFAENTIMDKIVKLLNDKQKVVDSVLDGEDLNNQDVLFKVILQQYEISWKNKQR